MSDQEIAEFNARVAPLNLLVTNRKGGWIALCDQHEIEHSRMNIAAMREALEELCVDGDPEFDLSDIDQKFKKKAKRTKKAKRAAAPAVVDDEAKQDEVIAAPGNSIVSCVNACHNILRNEDSIVGGKAMHDIMRLLFLKFLEPLIDSGDINILDSAHYGENDAYYVPGMERLARFSQFKSETLELSIDATKDMWKSIMCAHPLTSEIFKRDDFWNCSQGTLVLLLAKIDTIMDSEFAALDHDVKGHLYEQFLNGYNNNAGKSFGQYFTTRDYIQLIFDQIPKQQRKKFKRRIDQGTFTVLDPCMGTGGFLTEACKMKGMELTNPREQIFGSEIEAETYTYSLMNMILTTGTLAPDNFSRCDSLVGLDPREKFDFIPTNPPYGTKMNYKKLETRYNAKWDAELNPDDAKSADAPTFPRWKDIFPVKTNDGVALFLQFIAFKLKPGGVAVIVVPNGQIMFGKNFGKLRKCIMDQVDITQIMYTPGGVFKHAGVKTAVIWMRKPHGDLSADNIEFVETTKELTEPTHVASISIEQMEENNHSWDASYYKAQEIPDWGCEWKPLGDIADVALGGTPSRSCPAYWGGDNLWISVSSLGKGEIFDGPERITDAGIANSSTRLVEKGSVLMSFMMTVGKMGIAGCDLYTNQSIAAINPGDEALHKFVYYYLMHKKTFHTTGSIGAGGMNKASIKQIKIPVPPLDVQAAIVAELDEIELMKERLKVAIADQKSELAKSRSFYCPPFADYQDQIEWKPLEEICTSSNGQALNRADIREGKFPVVGGGKSPMGYHNVSNSPANTILCASSGSSGYLSRYQTPVWKSDCFSIEPMDNVNNQYIWLYLKNIQDKIYKFQTGAGQQHVYWRDLAKLKIPMLPLEVQAEFVKFYEAKEEKMKKMEAEITNSEARLLRLNDLGRAVIEKMICG